MTEQLSFKVAQVEGPLDLILQLISKHKLNIYDIEIAKLLEQYLDYVEQMQSQQLEVASEFLEMASRLVYIKSVSLLPKHEELEEQLKKFLEEHPDTRLVIIDTLQKIRGEGGEKYSYSNDYEVISRLKKIADDSGICLLLVHHTRKQQADDKFDMISGTNGLLGSADGAFLLYKENRTSTSAVLDVSGRDQQDQRLYLNRDKEHLIWELEEVETEIWVEPPDPVLEAVAKVVSEESPEWQGTASDLIALTGLDMKPNTLTLRLNVNAGRLMSEYRIAYESSRTHAGRRVKLALQPAVA